MRLIFTFCQKSKAPIVMINHLGLISAILITACLQTLPAVKVAEEPMVKDCEFVATISETTDPGRILDNYRPPQHQNKVLQRAANLGATHIVWVYDYRMGSSAIAYRCDP
jgi:hypothetical protein